jgi:hypothetical protein
MVIQTLLDRLNQLGLKRYAAEETDEYYRSSFGVLVNREFHGNLGRHNDLETDAYLLSEHFFETVNIIDSIAKADEQFNMLELGCGCGRWLAMASKIIEDNYKIPYLLMGVEAEPNHYQWAVNCMARNAVPPESYVLMNKAVVPEAGDYYIQICNSDAPLDDAMAPMKWYGQSLRRYEEIKPYIDLPVTEKEKAEYYKRPVTFLTYGEGYVPVPHEELFCLSGLKPAKGYINILTADIQGLEGDVFEAAASYLAEHVKKVHIGTHSEAIDERLQNLFEDMGWTPVFNYSSNSVLHDPKGDVRFVDGIVSYENPRFKKYMVFP